MAFADPSAPWNELDPTTPLTASRFNATLTAVGGALDSHSSRLDLIDKGADWSAGDNVSSRLSSPPDPLRLDIRHGSQAEPVNVAGNTLKVSRTDDARKATVEAAEGLVGTDGPDSMAAISGQAVALSTSEVQSVGVYGGVFSRSKAAPFGHDACGGYFKGHVGGEGATATAIGAYIEGTRDVTTAIVNALEVRARNNTLVNGTYVANGPSDVMGIYLNCDSPLGSDAAAGLQFGGVTGEEWAVGVGFNAKSVRDSSIRDDSSSLVSLDIRGERPAGGLAVKVAKMAGAVVLGASALTSTTSQLLEINSGGSVRDPLVKFNAGGNASYSVMFANATTSWKLGQVGVAGQFMLESAAGDGVLNAPAAGTFHLGRANSKADIKFGGGVGFYGTAPVAKQTGVAKTAEGIWGALNALGLFS
jgi:hypothetical protein